MLTPQERERFLGVINDPSSDIAQQLLSSEELLGTLREPWWKRSESPDDPTIPRNHHREQPSMMQIPGSMLKLVPNRPLLIYNLASIW